MDRGMSEMEALLRSGTARMGPTTPLPTSPAVEKMAAHTNTTAHIEVIADNKTRTVQLPQARYDNRLGKSIINKDKARETRGEPQSIEEVSLVDSTGKTYKSQSTIHVRWYAKDHGQSFGETFYVVDSCGEFDAMLRKDIMDPRETPAAQTHPFMLPRETVADVERRLAMAKAREEQGQLANVAREKRVREEYEQMRAELKRERENKERENKEQAEGRG